MINLILRKKAIDLMNEMELEAETITERRMIAVCWWMLYAMGFKEREDWTDSVEHCGKVTADLLDEKLEKV